MRLQQSNQPGSNPKWCVQRLNVLQRFIAPDSVGVELGVFKGSFIDYLLSCGPRKLFAVDPWYRCGAIWPWARGDKSTLSALLNILGEFRIEIERGILEPRIQFSEEFLATIDEASLDWIYIDTTHKYEQTLMEIELSRRALRPGGIIMGDDFYADPNSLHYGVYRAVREKEREGLIEVLVAGDAYQFVARFR